MRRSKQRRNEQSLAALGQALRQIRLERDLSQEELGYRAQIHRTYVTDIENGLRNMSLLTLIKIVHALDVQLSTVIAQAEESHNWQKAPVKPSKKK